MAADWNSQLYQSSHSFVWKHGLDLVDLLAPRAGERLLDAGCGAGQLTAEIARRGAEVLGVDKSAAMIDQARANFPGIGFEIMDVGAMRFENEFDAVFSNAVLHWVRDAESVAVAVARALKRGRFVAEFGGHGNTRHLLDAVYHALRELGVEDPERLNPWYYPRIGEYASVLERQGLAVSSATLFDRPTPLEGGMQGLANWIAMFGASFTGGMDPERKERFLRLVERHAAPHLLRDGVWTADYRRLRVLACKARW